MRRMAGGQKIGLARDRAPCGRYRSRPSRQSLYVTGSTGNRARLRRRRRSGARDRRPATPRRGARAGECASPGLVRRGGQAVRRHGRAKGGLKRFRRRRGGRARPRGGSVTAAAAAARTSGARRPSRRRDRRTTCRRSFLRRAGGAPVVESLPRVGPLGPSAVLEGISRSPSVIVF